MQGAINSLGTILVAAQTAGEKIRQMFTLSMESVGMAMATYTGKNYSAKRTDRIKQGIKSGLMIQGIYCVVVWVVLGEMKSEVALEAVRYLSVMSMFFFIHGSLMVMRNVL